MSAFIVSKKHIDYIMTAYQNSKNKYHNNSDKDYYTNAQAEQDGQMLWNENYLSVNHRYEESNYAPAYKFDRIKNIDYLQALKFIHCLDYQSCETDDYNQSKAQELLTKMAWGLTCMIPEYENLKWDYIVSEKIEV